MAFIGHKAGNPLDDFFLNRQAVFAQDSFESGPGKTRPDQAAAFATKDWFEIHIKRTFRLLNRTEPEPL